MQSHKGTSGDSPVRFADFNAEVARGNAELGWTLEDNEMINRTVESVESVGARRYKRYRIYERTI